MADDAGASDRRHRDFRLRVVCFTPYPPEAPTVRLRIDAYRGHLAQRGIDLVIQAFMTRGLYRRRRQPGLANALYKGVMLAVCSVRLCWRVLAVAGARVAIIHREAFPLGPPLVERTIIALSRRSVYDLDDALWVPPPVQVDQRRIWRDPQRVAGIMSRVSAVVAGNETVRTYAAERNDDTTVIPTPYQDLGGPLRREAGEARRPVVVWIGSDGNTEYLLPIAPALAEAACTHPFVLRVIGGPDVHTLELPGVTVEALDWNLAREGQWLRDADIGIMPLGDTEFDRGKSAFKIVQYFSAGLAVIASPVGMNAEIVRDGVNGLLATSVAQWRDALRALLGDPPRRQAMGEKGYDTYRQRFLVEQAAHQWAGLILRLGCPHAAADGTR